MESSFLPRSFCSTACGMSLEPPCFSLLSLSPASLDSPSHLLPPSDGANREAQSEPVTHSDLWGPVFGDDNGTRGLLAHPPSSQWPTPLPHPLAERARPLLRGTSGTQLQ